MAQITSLGIRRPIALPHLIAEGVLPHEPSSQFYQWTTYVFDDGNGDVEEEVLATRHCVIWSQGKLIRSIYHFELEGEAVTQALLTRFVTSKSQINEQSPTERALVVILKSKAHVHFLNGSSHIVDLPFETAKAFPAPRGILLQRKAINSASPPTTPQVPAAPPNSFFSSQLHPTSSYPQSPTLARSFANAQPSRPSPLSGKSRLDALLHDVLGSPSQSPEEDVASIFSLSDPLSDVGVVTYSLQHIKPRLSGKTQVGLSVGFEPLDAGEEIVYASPRDELSDDYDNRRSTLMFVVTANQDLRMLTIWHAWYVQERSLTELMKERAALIAAKARRRSSFMTNDLGTGATTPAVRQRDGVRESLAGVPVTRAPGDQMSVQHKTTHRRPTRQEEEEAMASQMDPDYQPSASQQAARESRRISSLNTDVRQSQHNPNASFAPGRRNTSFGGQIERRSFGHRKSRGSTPGSVFSRSYEPDDDFMDVDGSFNADDEESVESIVRHIRATFEAAGADGLLSGVTDEMKRELVVRKVHSLSLAESMRQPENNDIRVVTFRDDQLRCEDSQRRLNMYIHQRANNETTCLNFLVKERNMWPASRQGPTLAVPMLVGESSLNKGGDILKLKDGLHSAILLQGRGLLFSLADHAPWPLPTQAAYRMHDPRQSSFDPSRPDVDFGKNRILSTPTSDALRAFDSGAQGRYDEQSIDGLHHRRQIQLGPRNPTVIKVIKVCKLVLPARQSQMLAGIWCMAHSELMNHPQNMADTTVEREWMALISALFVFLLENLDPKARASLKIARVAVSRPAQSRNSQPRRPQHESHQVRNAGSKWLDDGRIPSDASTASSPTISRRVDGRQNQLLPLAAALADELLDPVLENVRDEPQVQLNSQEALKLMLALHIAREENKLSTLKATNTEQSVMAALIAQIGSLIGLPAWSCEQGTYYYHEGATRNRWAFITSRPSVPPLTHLMDEPVGVFHWFEHAMNIQSSERYPTLDVIAILDCHAAFSLTLQQSAVDLTPTIAVLSDVLESTHSLSAPAERTVELMARFGVTTQLMETLPAAIAAPLQNAIVRCEKDPPASWSSQLLRLVGRGDLVPNKKDVMSSTEKSQTTASAPRDIQTICYALEHQPPSARTKEASRHAISQLLFSDDRRLVEATSLMHFNSLQMAECPKQPDWSDTQHFEQQRKMTLWVTVRMVALPAGDAMMHFDCQTPLLTDKYHLPGFSNSCLMQPMGHTLMIDRSGLTEEKVGWAYFHAGASAGLRISRTVTGIDTSWIAFNKPTDLTNRHAGLLLALGLNGHLKHVAKWLSFKYLTPKHTMTSVGLLLGLSASYMGTMDSLITRMLSVHITRMLPPGAAELNVSSLTQTAGLIGIGLLYYNTQHRRMSEIMLSEVEHMETEDPDSGPDPLRDECYRLAAGFALGYINIGKGKDLRGLHGMHLPERLLVVAVGPRPVSAVHVFDRATAGAVIALTLVYMKSGDRAIARKIDIPDTEAQFDHVRPDMLMLRAMANQVILWDTITVRERLNDAGFIQRSLPACYQGRLGNPTTAKHILSSADVPFLNIATGLAWALSLKYAGSGNTQARDEILGLMDHLHKLRGGADAYFYDAKLAQSTVRRCIDVLGLAAATVMAGTGDLQTFRYLRRLHGRVEPEATYGSHLAGHMAIGVLFLGGGTYTLGTSNKAIASLICAFYPLFPEYVHDNRVHLQPLRHFWVFAADARCLVVEEIDTHRPVSMPIIVTGKDGATTMLSAPCLLPDLETIATIQTSDPSYWKVTLDFARNPEHLAIFRRNQRIFVRQCPAVEAHDSAFASTLAALNPSQAAPSLAVDDQRKWRSLLTGLSVGTDLDQADVELILPPNAHSSVHTDERGTIVDERLALSASVNGSSRDSLWDLRVLFAWAERARAQEQGPLRWLGDEVVDELKARIDERTRQTTV